MVGSDTVPPLTKTAVTSPADISAALLRSRLVIALVGPTASGKTAVSVELARALNVEIISADSRQVYRFLDIGTAKPSSKVRSLIPHHFVDELTPDRDFSAGEFGMRGREVIADIFSRGRVVLVVGGSGLYVKSLLDGFFDGPGSDPETRAELEKRLAAEGVDSLMNELREVDPEFAAAVDPTKPRRIVRALEVYRLTGTPLSTHHADMRPKLDFSHIAYGLRWERAELYRRIEERCDEMIRTGLLEEIDHLAKLGYTDSLNALNTVGYAEAFAHRRGELGFDDMVRLMKQNTRNYAKRQMTWFRKDPRIRWIDASRRAEQVAREILADLSTVVH